MSDGITLPGRSTINNGVVHTIVISGIDDATVQAVVGQGYTSEERRFLFLNPTARVLEVTEQAVLLEYKQGGTAPFTLWEIRTRRNGSFHYLGGYTTEEQARGEWRSKGFDRVAEEA